MFEVIAAAPADPILGLTEAFRADPREYKVNLGVGVYKDANGNTPILPSVKAAEKRLLEIEKSKGYLGISGLPEYDASVQALLFGNDSAIIATQRARTAQAPGGTGALRIAAEFYARQLPNRRVWVSDPTWANHDKIFAAAELDVQRYRYYDAQSRGLDFEGMLASLSEAKAGDLVLLHGCCHNPTGVDPTPAQWQQLAALSAERGWLPLFDFAYQGFAKDLDSDAVGLRAFTATHNELMIANSFSKNFGLYNERIGALTLVAKDSDTAESAFSQVKATIRANYSNPPAHGAKVVYTILSDKELRAQWENELAEMRSRIHQMRQALVAGLKARGIDRDFSFIEQQSGMFSFSGLNPEQVQRLRDEFAIYIVGSGRINVAGMTPSNLDYLCDAIASVL